LAATTLIPAQAKTTAWLHNVVFTAQDQYPNDIAVECAITRITPADRSHNPEYKVNVVVSYNNGKIQSMDVIHTLMNGQQVDRSQQYSNSQLSQRGNIATWVGYRGPLKMTGVFNPNSMTYVEHISRNGRVETQIDTRCHPSIDSP
jgi:hypothetical protein